MVHRMDIEYWLKVWSPHKDSLLLALVHKVYSGHESAVPEIKEFLEAQGTPGDFSLSS